MATACSPQSSLCREDAEVVSLLDINSLLVGGDASFSGTSMSSLLNELSCLLSTIRLYLEQGDSDTSSISDAP